MNKGILLKLIAVISGVISICTLSAQVSITQTIRGRIIDKYSQVPLPGVNVIVESVDPIVGTSTDIDGYFRIENVPVGRHEIKVSYLGYNDIYLNNIALTSSKQSVLNLSMEERVEEVEEVTITAHKKAETLNKMATVSARTFSVEETQRYAGSMNDVSKMAMNFAGVKGADDAVNDIVIRGNSPLGLLWRLDGVDIPNPNHFGDGGATGGPVGMLNNNVLGNSDFFTGAFPAEYGNAVSGVFDLHMRNGNDDKHEFLGQIGFNGFELGAEGPLSRKNHSSYLINYRLSNLDVMSKMGMDFGTGTAIPRYQDLTGKVHVPTENAGTFDLFWLGGYSSIEFLDSERDTSEEKAVSLYESDIEMDIYSKTWMGVSGLSHKKIYKNKMYSKVTLAASYSKNGNEVDSVVPLTRDVMPMYRSYRTRTNYISHGYLNWKLNKKHNLRLGLIGTYQTISLQDSALWNDTGHFNPLVDFVGESYFFQPYINWQYKLTDAITFNSGIHAQYLALNQNYSIEPRVGMKWQFTEKDRINIGYGLHSQLPPLEDMMATVEQRDGSFTSPNTDLDFTKSHHFVLGYDHSFNSTLRFKSEVYYQKLFNVPVATDLNTYSLLNKGSFSYSSVDTLVNEGEGENYGLELTVEKFMDKGFYALSTVSLYESKYKAYDGQWRNTAFNGNYVFNVLGGKEFQITKKENAKNRHCLTVDVKYTHAGGQYYCPVFIEKSREEGSTRYDYRPDKAYSEKFADYIRLDFRIGWKTISKKYTQEWAFDLQNATNRKNPYREVFNATTGGVETQYQLGIFPMMLYRITF